MIEGVRGRVMSTWDGLRENFWFVPAVLVSFSIALALTLAAVDAEMPAKVARALPFVRVGSPDGARTMLSVLASAMITVTSLTFSLTIIALTLASQQFGPRLLRNFTRDRATQFALGTFVATFAYCLIVLQAVKDEGEVFVPNLSVAVAQVLAILSLVVLVYFVHHVAKSIQVSSLLATVAGELDQAVSRLFPEMIGEEDAHVARAGHDVAGWDRAHAGRDPFQLRADRDGYVQFCDGDALLVHARDHDLTIDLLCRPGDFVQRGQAMMRAWPPGAAEDQAGALAATIVLGPQRTLLQDATFAIEQFVEVAVRALSPGVNDPVTAQACIDRLGAALRQVALRNLPAPIRLDSEGVPRLRARPVTFDELVRASFTEIRRAACGHTAVTIRLLDTCTMMAPALTRPADRAAVADAAAVAAAEAERTIQTPEDAAEVARAHAACREALAVPAGARTMRRAAR